MSALNPFITRPDEWELFSPLVGKTICELGNKRNTSKHSGSYITYKSYFVSLGFKHTSVDINGLDGALKKDLTQSLNLGTFDMISNIGTTEHVSPDDWNGQMACWQNIAHACHVGTVFISGTPAPGAWPRHGTWYPTEEFYKQFADDNGFTIERLYRINEGTQTEAIMCRMVLHTVMPFRMPDKELMYRNNR